MLIQCGYLDVLRRHGAAGDWNCASAWASAVVERGAAAGRDAADADAADADAALEMLAPFAATGLPAAIAQTARILAAAGRVEEALTLARANAGTTVGAGEPVADLEGHPAGERAALRLLAELLVAQGRRSEAFEVLRPYATHWSVTDAWVAAAEGLGRDAEVAEVLTAMVAEHPGAKVGDLAEVLIRSGRAEEAEALLRPRLVSDGLVHLSLIRQLVDLLVARGREDTVRELIAGPPGKYAAAYFAEVLEARGDRDAALATLAPFSTEDHQHQLIYGEMLLRADRLPEASEVLLALDSGFIPGSGLRALCATLADRDRHAEALALIDEAARRAGGLSLELLKLRATTLAARGDVDQAIAELRAHPQGDSITAAIHIAELLSGAGRLDESLAVLAPHSETHLASLEHSMLLIRLGRAEEGIEIALRRPRSQSRTE